LRSYALNQPVPGHFDSNIYLVEHFLLTPADLQLVLICRGEANPLTKVFG
jgi:hypothetical protein